MSNSPNVTNFVTDLVAMAKATEELPIIKQALAGETEHANRLAQTVQDRELAILDLKAQLEAAQAKIRQTEAERDDAELRFLELDEKAHTVLGVLDLIAAKASASKASLEPPKPEPTPEPVSVPQDPTSASTSDAGTTSPPTTLATTDSSTQGTGGIGTQASGSSVSTPTPNSQGQSESHPTPAPASPTPTGTESASSGSEHHTPVPPAPAYTTNPTSGGEAGSSGQSETPKADTSQDSGQSASPPTLEASSQSSPVPTHSGQVGSEHSSQHEEHIATGTAYVQAEPEEVKGPYSGEKYWGFDNFISRSDWIAGGGTNEDYDWHPQVS